MLGYFFAVLISKLTAIMITLHDKIINTVMITGFHIDSVSQL